MSLTVQTQKLSEAALDYFFRFDNFTEKHTLRLALRYLQTECEKVLSLKDIAKAGASKQRAELVLNGARMRLKQLEEAT